jgi:hypothetical protein
VADQFVERLTALRTEGDPIGLTGAIQRAQDFRAAVSSAVVSTSAHATVIPRRDNRWAISRPSPRPAPVTIAIL